MQALKSFPFWIPLLPVVAWVSISLLLAFLGGWQSLARAYRTQEPIRGERFWLESAGMRYGLAYRGVINFGVDSYGLFVSVFPIFRIGHPPLLIPWTDIFLTPKEGRLLGGVKVGFRRVPGAQLLLQSAVASRLFAKTPVHLPAA